MKFRHSGPTHTVTRISGPTHNFLKITFIAEGGPSEPRIVELPPIGACRHRPLDRGKILAAVLAGVEEGNRESGAGFVVAEVEFVANDTGPEEVYRSLARSLVAEVSCREDGLARGRDDPVGPARRG